MAFKATVTPLRNRLARWRFQYRFKGLGGAGSGCGAANGADPLGFSRIYRRRLFVMQEVFPAGAANARIRFCKPVATC
jgi:hypothetical protein